MMTGPVRPGWRTKGGKKPKLSIKAPSDISPGGRVYCIGCQRNTYVKRGTLGVMTSQGEHIP